MNPDNIMPSTMRSSNDYGLKVAKKGFDAQYASNNQLLYNSSFPVLQIVMYLTTSTQWEVIETGSYTFWNDTNGSTSTRYMHKMRRIHGLGYPPMIVPLSTLLWGFPDYDITWDSKYIYFEKDFSNNTAYDNFINNGSPTGDYVVFGIDIETDVEYPYTDIGIDTDWGQIYDYGLKHYLSSNMDSTNPNDFGLDINIQSIMAVGIKVATSDKPNVNIYIPNGISMDRLAPFCFIKMYNDRWRQGLLSVQNPSGYVQFSDYYLLNGQYFGRKCSLVVVRMPMISSDLTSTSFNM